MNTKKAESNQKRSAETKEKIRRSAEELFKERGYDDTSVESIVERAGVSKGAFYVHFDSKESLVADSITDTIRWLDSSYETVLNSYDDSVSASEILLALLDRLSNNITFDLGYAINKASAIIQVRKATNHDKLMAFNKGLYDAVFKLIDTGMKRYEFKTNNSAQTIADDILTTIRGFIVEWLIRYPDMDLKDCLRKHFEIYLAGLQTVSPFSGIEPSSAPHN